MGRPARFTAAFDDLVGRGALEQAAGQRRGILLPAGNGPGDGKRYLVLGQPEQLADDVAVPQQAGDHGIFAALDPLEQHRLAAFQPLGDAGQFEAAVHFGLDPAQLARPIEKVDAGAEIDQSPGLRG
ncbi:MAG: hypothetical protein IPP18_00815 [Rhodocyclaceae bacterium]|nr:hypothetical protein [Rhodocyclaceae bacterium]